jgi:hypothetical protein
MPPCDTTPTLWLQSYRRAQTSSSEGSPPYPVRGERAEGFGVRSFAVSTSSQEARTRRDRQFDTGEETRPRRVWSFNGFGCLCVRACMRACLRRKRETWRHIIACGVGGMGVYFGGGMTPHATKHTKTTEPTEKTAKRTSSFRPVRTLCCWARLAGECVVAVSQGWIRAVGSLFDAFDNAKS